MAQEKILVAVHGIGDQTAYQTAQSVAYRLCAFYDVPLAIPLGRFHDNPGGAFIPKPPLDPDLPDLGFAEAYWAGVPRDVVKEGYTLEEAKRWARTIMARVALNAQNKNAPLTPRQYLMIQAALDELIDVVFVLENLTFLADRAGVFKFNLKKLLDDFLNDVQVVAEFSKRRDEIVGIFHKGIKDIFTAHPGAELYIVAHSEGTVVAFLGLLQALDNPKAHPWIRNVRGLMTIGSAIEIHILLWPRLWEKLHPAFPPAQPIQWRNYYDYGDPIAYELEATRKWLDKDWPSHFSVKDHAFGRYPLPGKAHVDYWSDDHVFGHFMENVVLNQPKNYKKPPPNKFWARSASYALPYLLVYAIIFAAVYFLYRPVNNALTHTDAAESARAAAAISNNGRPNSRPESRDGRAGIVLVQRSLEEPRGIPRQSEPTILGAATMLKNVAALSLLLAGITAVVRVLRLIRSPGWILAAGLLFAAGVWSSWQIEPATLAMIEALPAYAATLLGYDMPFGPGWPLAILAALVVIAGTALSLRYPSRGVRPLIVPGAIAVLSIVVYLLIKAPPGASVWPVLLGAAVFFYLWWLAALLLDLTVVWHHYARQNGAINYLRGGTPKTSPENNGPITRGSGEPTAGGGGPGSSGGGERAESVSVATVRLPEPPIKAPTF
jgi:hypothetical protein